MAGLSPDFYLGALGIGAVDPDGPHLLLPELSALLLGLRVWIPFRASRQLADARWIGCGIAVVTRDQLEGPGCAIDAVYFGVPTIVDDRAFFGAPGWNVRRARNAARIITENAIRAGAKLIVSGLGSGDIAPDQRIEDMGGGDIIVHKRFDLFEDWIIARWL